MWFSDDHGATWSRSSEFGFGTAEGSLVELFESSAGGGRPLRASLRVDSPSKCKCVGRNGSVPAAYVKHCRRNALSRDGGDTWSDLHDLASLPDPGVRGGMTTAPAHRAIVVTNPNNESVRTNMSVHVSVNDGATYGSSLQFWEGVGGYSDVARHPIPPDPSYHRFPVLSARVCRGCSNTAWQTRDHDHLLVHILRLRVGRWQTRLAWKGNVSGAFYTTFVAPCNQSKSLADRAQVVAPLFLLGPLNTKGYSSTYLAMGFANVRAGTWYPPEH